MYQFDFKVELKTTKLTNFSEVPQILKKDLCELVSSKALKFDQNFFS